MGTIMDTVDKYCAGVIAVCLIVLLVFGAWIGNVNSKWDRMCAAAGGVHVKLYSGYTCAKLELLTLTP